MSAADLMTMSLPSAMLRTVSSQRLPPAWMLMRPSCAVMLLTTSAVASLIEMSPLTLETTLMLLTSVLSCTPLRAVTSRWSPMNTEAPSALMAVALSTMSPPRAASALTMPPCTVSVPRMSSVTLRAGS